MSSGDGLHKLVNCFQQLLPGFAGQFATQCCQIGIHFNEFAFQYLVYQILQLMVLVSC